MTDVSVNQQIAKGSYWTVLFRFVEKFISVFSTIILARLLIPADFGIIAIGMVVVGFIDVFRAIGVDAALIQNQNAGRNLYDTAWTFKIIMALLAASMLALVADSAASFFNEPRLAEVLRFLAIGMAVTGFENIGIIAFRKEMRFNKDFTFMVSRKLVSFTVTVLSAVILRSYWALVIGSVLTNFYTVALSYYMHHYRPRLSLASYRELTSFSLWMFANNLLNFAYNSAPQFIVGRFLPTAALGHLTVTKDICSAATTAIVVPINRAAFPGYAKLSNNLMKLKQSFLGTFSGIVAIVLPASFGLYSITHLLVPLALGDAWSETIPLMEVLAFAAGLTALSEVYGIYVAIGAISKLARLTAIKLLIFVPLSLYLLPLNGIEGVVWAYAITSFVVLPLVFFPVSKRLSLSVYDFFQVVSRPLLASLIMAVTVRYYIDLAQNLLPELNLILMLAGAVMVGGTVYVGLLLILWILVGRPKSIEFFCLEVVQERFEKLRARFRARS
ncbi:lipopolysaccharide biosynthesis protein [Pseudomaricurvus alkylphenolicus]|uniref:lipopolysaccharide biosynthesis protein n=1 Tax=Pseudomaricurvus alkylphenolicus TaxID=1306991 RepID=UPI0014249721|nr:lipopolysaccharide biosynthesis protein [Pseudomaricurvus alkylphenolicus]NIB43121.1 lipopolysaccharide biosynthesis protein [Pseudomaricurvus alkylphenolicus]